MDLFCEVCNTKYIIDNPNILSCTSCPYCKKQDIIDGKAETSEYYKDKPIKLAQLKS